VTWKLGSSILLSQKRPGISSGGGGSAGSRLGAGSSRKKGKAWTRRGVGKKKPLRKGAFKVSAEAGTEQEERLQTKVSISIRNFHR